ncbi:UNVERIFIED_CONTAM: hypothetical protein Slati_3419800 [Sesamum latifolium]|uniref:Uncharacterized protein n=1 Tax=Sesamum latifolium TaxID=2727402 RepID=A0AAW2UFZ6_9LAMI
MLHNRLDRFISTSQGAEQGYQGFRTLHKHIQLEPEALRDPARRPKRFRFEVAWLREQNCEETIRLGWTAKVKSGNAAAVPDHIRNLCVHLLQWERGAVGNIRSQIRRLRERILAIRRGPLNTNSIKLLEELKSELEECLAREEIL